jgi:hypothetical protein
MKKRKANNAHKRAERVCKAALKNCAVSFLAGGNGKCRLVDIKSGRIFSPTLSLARIIESGKYTWSVYCAVFCRDQTGKEYMQGVTIKTNEPCQQSDLLNVLHEQHLSLLKGCNDSHTLNVGWLASPVGHEWDEKEVGDIFTKLNAWDFNTKLENDHE